MQNKVFAIITAAGSGTRFGAGAKREMPKQFQSLSGKPVILYSMTAFQKCSEVSEIIISANRDYFDFLHNLAAKHKIKKLSKLVEGGKTRFESVKNAFKELGGGNKDFVLIHDAVRPNIKPSMVEKLLQKAFSAKELIPGVRVTETLKRSNRGYISESVRRDDLWTIQTPQIFRYKVLKDAYKKCGRKNDFTDESSLVEYAGYKVGIIEGSHDNIKITTPLDMRLLKKLMR